MIEEVQNMGRAVCTLFVLPCPQTPICHASIFALMAHNREWDKGKDTWNEGAAWGAAVSGSHIRAREEDFYGDGKRRKFNNGVCRAHAPHCIQLIQCYRASKDMIPFKLTTKVAKPGIPTIDKATMRKNKGMKTVLGVVQGVSPRNAWHPLSRVPMSSS